MSNNKRVINLLLNLRRLSEARAHEAVVAREVAVRAAERSMETARVVLRQHMTASNEHERRAIESLKFKIMTSSALERLQLELDALEMDGTLLAKQVAMAQSTTRIRISELKDARLNFLQKRREVMKLDTFSKEQTEREERQEAVISEIEEGEAHAMRVSDPFKTANSHHQRRVRT